MGTSLPAAQTTGPGSPNVKAGSADSFQGSAGDGIQQEYKFVNVNGDNWAILVEDRAEVDALVASGGEVITVDRNMVAEKRAAQIAKAAGATIRIIKSN